MLADAGQSMEEEERLFRSRNSRYADNKELLIITDLVHTDLYDGGGKNAIPFDKLESFFREYLR